MTETEVGRWYDEELADAFPETERKPLADIMALRAAGKYELWGLFDGSVLAGYATLWMYGSERDYILLDYLGVTAARRNSGLGKELLRRIIERYEGRSGVLMESEAPIPGDADGENGIRLRRIDFYRRCGCLPLYEMATCGMRFLTLVGGPVPESLEPVMAEHRKIYGPERDDVQIPLGPDERPRPPRWMREN